MTRTVKPRELFGASTERRTKSKLQMERELREAVENTARMTPELSNDDVQVTK
jgi:hypothetical protein